MRQKVLKVGIYDADSTLVLEKCPVNIDAIPGVLQLCPDGGYVRFDICDLPSSAEV